MKVVASVILALAALSATDAQRRRGRHGHRRYRGRKGNQIQWEAIKKDQGRRILCRMNTQGWCTNLATKDMLCDRVHSGTYSPSGPADAKLVSMGMDKMCGTHWYYECNWGTYSAKQCDEETQRFWKPTADLFPEFLGHWQEVLIRKAKWWGYCRSATEEQPPMEQGWEGKYNLRYDDDQCTWVKEIIPEATTVSITSKLSDEEYYDFWKFYGEDI
jgi:hypothetical protein